MQEANSIDHLCPVTEYLRGFSLVIVLSPALPFESESCAGLARLNVRQAGKPADASG
jgi:hypothetical protein